MPVVRHLLAQRHLAVLICTAALLLKVLIPTGYMISSDHGHVRITICSGAQPRTLAMAMPGTHDDLPDHGKSKDHAAAEAPCAFAGFSAAALGATDPIQLGALVIFIMAMGVVNIVRRPPLEPGYLRPPLRGPPSTL